MDEPALPFTQEGVYLSITTPLGPDVLVLKKLSGEDALSEPFLYVAEMVSTLPAIDPALLLGQRVTVTMILADGITPRYFNGIVTRFVRLETTPALGTRYQAELRPWFWLLTLNSDNRVFQNLSTPMIISTLLAELGLTDFRLALTGVYLPRPYCVQYGESTFAFISRLLEDEGIFYFFEHTLTLHTLVLADSAAAFLPCPGTSTALADLAGDAPLPAAAAAFPVEFDPAISERSDDVVGELSVDSCVTTSSFALQDYNYLLPTLDLMAVAPPSGLPSTMPPLSRYEYPGWYGDLASGLARALIRQQECEAATTLIRGAGRSRAFIAGCAFTPLLHPTILGVFVLRRVQHDATLERYRNSFESFPILVPFRPPRSTRRPRMPGPQTAVVVGMLGQEIFTDPLGCVKVQFHWDRLGMNNEFSSCFIRVAQKWAGMGYGSFYFPRIGQEVVVEFLDGNPDRPLITGVVYNAVNTLPVLTPVNQTQSGVKTSSSLGGIGFNQILFEDLAGSELFQMNAQKDMVTDVLENYTVNVGGNLTFNVTGSVSVNALQNVSTLAGMSISDTAGLNISHKAGLEISSLAGLEISNKAGLEVSSYALLEVSNKALLEVSNAALLEVNNEALLEVNNYALFEVSNEALLTVNNQALLIVNNDAALVATSESELTPTLQAGVVIAGALILGGA